MATILSVNISQSKGVRKTPVKAVRLEPGLGVRDDAHAGPGNRQVSLLAQESIEKMKAKGLNLNPGDFAENITTSGLELHVLPIGAILKLGEAWGEVSQIGKTCHQGCEIKHQVGDCIMPREGIFVRVLKAGQVKPGDALELMPADRQPD